MAPNDQSLGNNEPGAWSDFLAIYAATQRGLPSRQIYTTISLGFVH